MTRPGSPPIEPVFVSYNRSQSGAAAEALWKELGDEHVFLDRHDIEDGTDFVDSMVAALLGARVIVVFAHDAYFQSPYCTLEWEVAVRGYEEVVRRGSSERDREAALAHIVIALPGGASSLMRRLPQPLQRTSWPDAGDTAALAELVRRRVDEGVTYRERIAGLVDVELLGVETEPVLHPPGNPARVPRRALAGLPASIDRRFLGRGDDLVRIHRKLMGHAGPEGPPGRAVIVGSAGAGKTTLAAEYVHRFGPGHYPGGLFWVNAALTDEDGTGRQLHAILRAFDREVPDWKTFRYDQDRDVASELRDHLENLGPDERALYVVDNVPEPRPGEAVPPIETWCPAPSRVSLLVTSCVRLGDSDQRIHLDVLPPQAARAVLVRAVQAPDALTPGEWDEIAGWAGYLPLALQLLRAALEDRSLEPRQLLELARTSGPTGVLDQVALDADNPIRLPGVTEVLLRSYRCLSADGQAAARLVAQLAPVPVPTPLLDALGPRLAGANRSILLRRSFVTEVMGDRDVSSFGRMHPVVADFLRSQSDDPEAELSPVLDALIAVLSADGCRDPQAWPLLDACAVHAAHVYGRTGPAGISPPTREAGVVLGIRLAAFRRSAGRLSEAAAMALGVSGAAAETLGEGHRLTLSARSALAEARLAQGRLDEAELLQRDVLRVAEQSLPPDDPQTAGFRAALASSLADRGSREEALVLLGDAIASATRTLGADHVVTLGYRHREAAILAGAGRLDEAWQVQRRMVAAVERVLGPRHPFLLRANATLAEIAAGQGRLDVARHVLEKVVEEAGAILPAGHADRLGYLASLAAVVASEGEAEEAARLRREVVDAAGGLPGPLEPDVAHVLARTLAEEALALVGDQRPEEAATQLARALEASQSTGWTGLRAGIAWNLFVLLRTMGRPADAARVFRRELAPLTDAARLDAGQRQVRARLAQIPAH